MCGRFTLHHSPDEIADRFHTDETLFNFQQRYNVAPMQPVIVITRNAYGDNMTLLEAYRWGLVPSWAKDESFGSKMINARMETLLEKTSFRSALQRRRCLVVADGFYEWKTQGKIKRPFHIRFKDSRLFAFAGLWDEWISPDGSPLRTCTIITSEPNALLGGLHHRMAVMLDPQDEQKWLDPKLSMPEAMALLKVHPDAELEAFEVHKKVGNVAFDSADCILPLEADVLPAEEENGQLTLL